jgi:hypothetical protein
VQVTVAKFKEQGPVQTLLLKRLPIQTVSTPDTNGMTSNLATCAHAAGITAA